jgi:hypothetical protein
MAQFELIQSSLSSYTNILALTGKQLLGKDNFAYIEKFNEVSMTNAKNNISAAKA